MRITITATLAAALLGLSASLYAAGPMPERGMTQDAVRAKFGAPKRQVAPVGNPPISRWVYDDFTVYFEGRYSIHSVTHARTLTTPPPAAAGTAATPATVDELPPIEEIGADDTGTAAEAEAPAPAESTFRFDPASGRIIEIGPDGQPVQSPTAQSGSDTPAPAPQPKQEEDKPAATGVAPALAPAGSGTSMRFDPASGRMIEVGPDGQPLQPATPAPAPAPTPAPEPAPAPESAPATEPAPEPAAEAPAATPTPAPAPAPASGEARFRFDPATGRIVMEEDGPAEQPAPEPATTETPAAEPAPAEDAAPEPTPEAAAPAQAPAPAESNDGGDDGGGFSIQW